MCFAEFGGAVIRNLRVFNNKRDDLGSSSYGGANYAVRMIFLAISSRSIILDAIGRRSCWDRFKLEHRKSIRHTGLAQ
jgi:hypothetical protein